MVQNTFIVFRIQCVFKHSTKSSIFTLKFPEHCLRKPFLLLFFFLQMFIVGQTFDSWSSDINVQSMLGSFYLSSILLEYTLLTITKEIRLT